MDLRGKERQHASARLEFGRALALHRHNSRRIDRKIGVSINARHAHKVALQLDNFSDPVSSREQKTTPPGTRRLVIAVVLAIAAVGGLTLAERLRDRVPAPTPPHEPSQALMTTAAPVPEQVAPAQVPPPPPLEVRNDESLQAPHASDSAPSIVEGKPPGKPVASGEAPYMVQLGVFMTTTNAQALQKQLKRAGIDAHLETFVKVGPFKDRKEAEKALARAKRLGLKPVLVGPPANQ